MNVWLLPAPSLPAERLPDADVAGGVPEEFGFPGPLSFFSPCASRFQSRDSGHLIAGVLVDDCLGTHIRVRCIPYSVAWLSSYPLAPVCFPPQKRAPAPGNLQRALVAIDALRHTALTDRILGETERRPAGGQSLAECDR